MDFLKEVFGDGSLKFEDFEKAVGEKGLKLANLTEGKYVDKDKYLKAENDFKALKKTYDDLASAIDGDTGLKKQIETLKNEKADFESKYTSLNSELTNYKRGQAVLKAGVKADMSEYVSYEVGRMVNDNMDFDTALKGFLAKNPQYKAVESAPKVRTSAPTGGDGGVHGNDVNTKMNQALLSATGRK